MHLIQKINVITTMGKTGWMKIFCTDLKENAMEIINHEKKDIPPSTNKECESYLGQTNCHMC